MARGSNEKAQKRRLRDLVWAFTRRATDKTTIDPTDIATKVLNKLDPSGTVSKDFPYIYMAASFMFRQVTRQEIRKAPHNGQPKHPILPGFEELQYRYPKAHTKGKKPRYVLRDKMTRADWLWNLEQLRKSQNGLSKHQGQLKTWGEEVRGWREPLRHAG